MLKTEAVIISWSSFGDKSSSSKLHSFWHFHMTLECCSILSWLLRFQYSTNPSKFLRTQCQRWWGIILHAPFSVPNVQSCLCTFLDESQWLLYLLHIISIFISWVHCVDCIIFMFPLGHYCSLIWLFPSLLSACFVFPWLCCLLLSVFVSSTASGHWTEEAEGEWTLMENPFQFSSVGLQTSIFYISKMNSEQYII